MRLFEFVCVKYKILELGVTPKPTATTTKKKNS